MSSSSKGAAIVTGAARGIGKGIALRLANDGYDVALNDIAVREKELQALAKEIELLGRNYMIVLADVTDERSVIDMVRRTVTELGILRVVGEFEIGYHLRC